MDTQHVILLFMGMLLLSIILEPLAGRLKLPFAAALMVIGFLASELMVYFSIDTGIRWHNFYELIFYVFLPILIFEAAFNMDVRLLLRNLVPVLVLAIPLMLVSTGIIAVVLYYGINYPEGFPWVAALLTGALLSATDPAAILALFRKMKAPPRITMLLDGESLFNDAAAIVLFTLLVGIAAHSETDFSPGAETLKFAGIFTGGLLVGSIVGGIGYLVIPRLDNQVTQGVFSLVAAYMAYYLAESLLHVSGVMSVLIAGLALGHVYRQQGHSSISGFMPTLWAYKSYIANAMVFLISGVTIQLLMFTDQWLAILIGIFAVLFARAVSILGFFPLLNLFPGNEPVIHRDRVLMVWGGVRGVVTLALALSLPVDLPYWWTIQSIAYGVVIFTLLVQAPTIGLLIRRTNNQA